MSRSALTSIATAVRLAAASGVTAAQLAAATGLSHAQAGKILRGLEREGVLSGDSPTRSGAPRGSWGRTWKLELAREAYRQGTRPVSGPVLQLLGLLRVVDRKVTR